MYTLICASATRYAATSAETTKHIRTGTCGQSNRVPGNHPPLRPAELGIANVRPG